MADVVRDEGWFAALYAAHEPELRRYLARRGAPDPDAVVANVFGTLWRARDAAPAQLLPALFALARFKGGQVETDLVVRQVLDELPAGEGEALRLAHWEVLTTDEIATALGMRPSAAQRLLRNAKRRAGRLLDPGTDQHSLRLPDEFAARTEAAAPSLARVFGDNDPAAGLPQTPASVLRERAEAISSTDAEPIDWPRPPAPWWRRPRVQLAALLALVIALSPVLWREVIGPLFEPDPHEWAVETLLLAAENSGDPPVEPGQFWRIERLGTSRWEVSRAAGGEPSGLIVREQEVLYIPLGGDYACFDNRNSGEVIGTFGDPPPDARAPGGSAYQVYCVDGPWLSMPVDADELNFLLDSYISDHPLPPDQARYDIATIIIGTGLASAEVRSALFTMLAEVPGVMVLNSQAEIEGETGLLIGLDSLDPALTHLTQLLLDQKTGELLGYRYSAIPGIPEQEALLRREVVDAIPTDVRAWACQFAGNNETLGYCPPN